MDGVRKDEGVGTGAAGVVNDAIGGAGFQGQLGSAADKYRLGEGDGDRDDVTSVIDAVSSGAADGRNGRWNFIDIGDAARDDLGCGCLGSGIGSDRVFRANDLACTEFLSPLPLSPSSSQDSLSLSSSSDELMSELLND